MVVGHRERTAVEAETAIRDGQAIERRIELKRRDDPSVDRVVLLVADTRRNREALALLCEGLRDRYPLDGREVLGALGAGRHPPASGIVIL